MLAHIDQLRSNENVEQCKELQTEREENESKGDDRDITERRICPKRDSIIPESEIESKGEDKERNETERRFYPKRDRKVREFYQA